MHRDEGHFVAPRESNRNSRGSQLSQKSIITNPIEKPISLAGSKAAKG